jgi:hypothetical protein
MRNYIGGCMQSFKSYQNKEAEKLYKDILLIARLEDGFSREEPTKEDMISHNNLVRSVCLRIPEGTNIETLIKLVAIGEKKRIKERDEGIEGLGDAL